jgi:hypothetical protein
MIGFSIEFKRWYVVLRGPRGRACCAFGFAKQLPSFANPYHQAIDDRYSARIADEWQDDEEEQGDQDEELRDTNS